MPYECLEEYPEVQEVYHLYNYVHGDKPSVAGRWVVRVFAARSIAEKTRKKLASFGFTTYVQDEPIPAESFMVDLPRYRDEIPQ